MSDITFIIIEGLEYTEDVSDGLFSQWGAPKVLAVVWAVISAFKCFSRGGVGFSAASMTYEYSSMPRCGVEIFKYVARYISHTGQYRTWKSKCQVL